MQLKALYPSAAFVAYDYPSMLFTARDHYRQEPTHKREDEEKVQLVGGTADKLPFRDEGFDHAFSSLLFHWAKDADKITQEMHRVMKPGGNFVVSTIHPDYFKSGDFEMQDGNNYTFKKTRDTSHPQEIDVMLNQTIGPVTYYMRPVEQYKRMFEESGFQNVAIEAPVFSNEAKLQENEHLRRYRNYPLYLFITGNK